MPGWIGVDVAAGGAGMVDREKTDNKEGSTVDVHSQDSPGSSLEVDPSPNPMYVYIFHF